jgi:hypothetical protein
MNMKIWVLLINLFLFINTTFCQNATKLITYEVFENGKLQTNNTIQIVSSQQSSKIINKNTADLLSIDYKNKKTIKTGIFNNKNYTVLTPFDSLVKPEITNMKDTILGYVCTKYNYDLFSNRIEVWVTNSTTFKGCPSISFVPTDGLVLKYVQNGNRTIVAKKIEDTNEKTSYDIENQNIVDNPTFLAAQINSRYTTIPIFQKEQINFEKIIISNQTDSINKTYRFSNGNIILKKINIPKEKGNYFLKLREWSNGDAYDRVGSVFTIPNKGKSMMDAFKNGLDKLPFIVDNNGEKYQGVIANENYVPAMELMRFFTPFGVSHFNNKRIIAGYQWSDSVIYKQDVTDLIPSDESEMWFGVFIGNYDKGGHKVSLDLQFYPEPELPNTQKLAFPLFNTVNIMEASGQNYGKLFQNDTLEMSFTIPDSVSNLELIFTTTGHGGWENGDEFVPKENQIILDNQPIFQHTPWRSDCGTNRLHNPASGNFPNGMSSSDYSRSNWCPGALTPPFRIPLKNLKAGNHHLKVIIDQGKNEGSSFSHWCISGVLIGNKK